MSQRVFSLTAGVVFLLIALGHILRVAFDLSFIVQEIPVPMWASVLAVIFMGRSCVRGLSVRQEDAR